MDFHPRGGVPDKLCILPADESKEETAVQGSGRWLVWPRHEFFHV